MHRDEAIYARADAHAITLTAEEAALVLLWKRDAGRHGFPMGTRDDALAVRLKAASTTLPS